MQGERINVIEVILTYTYMHVSVFTYLYIDIHTYVYVYNAQYVDIISYIFYSSNSYQGHLMSSDTPT